MAPRQGHFKDEILNRLGSRGNIAQFVSFGPDLRQRFAWIHGKRPNYRFKSPTTAVQTLLAASPESSVNVRSFEPDNPKSREFLYGLRSAEEVLEHVRRLAAEGLTTIVNETIDVNDGGISGVAFGGIVEFAPGDTPRAVEKQGTASLPRGMAMRLFRMIYGFAPELPTDPKLRVEFSIHPLKRGYRLAHTVIWELESSDVTPRAVAPSWPNRFSRFIGDKAFGLAIAHLLGLPVPRTLVIPRKTAPFSFGLDTGSAEPWIRTCPVEQVPGKFTTRRGWVDPFRLLQEEDPEGTAIASILMQAGVEAEWSGALVTQRSGKALLEGVAGQGDDFMVGRRAAEPLPSIVQRRVLQTFRGATERLGPVRFEWVYAGKRVWIVQLHCGATATEGRVIFPGQAATYHSYATDTGIEGLRTLINRVSGTGEGIVLLGRVGITSHFGDLLRRARIPSRIEDPAA
jgi:hypothetical protein